MDGRTGPKKTHTTRKNYRSAELHKQSKLERNQKRGKQIWIQAGRGVPGHWERYLDWSDKQIPETL